MENKKKFLDVIGIPMEDLKFIGGILVFKIAQIKKLFRLMNYYYQRNYFPFLKSEDILNEFIELIGEIYISSLISGETVFDISDGKGPANEVVGFNKKNEILIGYDKLFILGKIALILMSLNVFSYEIVEAGSLIITSCNKFNFLKRDMITVSAKIQKYSFSVTLQLVDAGLMEFKTTSTEKIKDQGKQAKNEELESKIISSEKVEGKDKKEEKK